MHLLLDRIHQKKQAPPGYVSNRYYIGSLVIINSIKNDLQTSLGKQPSEEEVDIECGRRWSALSNKDQQEWVNMRVEISYNNVDCVHGHTYVFYQCLCTFTIRFDCFHKLYAIAFIRITHV